MLVSATNFDSFDDRHDSQAIGASRDFEVAVSAEPKYGSAHNVVQRIFALEDIGLCQAARSSLA
jgi:hypothetical protein